jgi:hypothetical protein|tara:strand:+ start:3187 stop:3411 length:225 start_codon:yes stop_codon:yes gene_type:complete
MGLESIVRIEGIQNCYGTNLNMAYHRGRPVKVTGNKDGSFRTNLKFNIPRGMEIDFTDLFVNYLLLLDSSVHPD